MSNRSILEIILNSHSFYFNDGILSNRNSQDALLSSVRRCSSELDQAICSLLYHKPSANTSFIAMSDKGDILNPQSIIEISDKDSLLNLYSLINEHMIPFGLMAGDRYLAHELAEKAVKFSSNVLEKGAYKHHILGNYFMQLENFRDAKYEFEQSLVMDRNNPHGGILLGKCYEELNDLEKAAKAYEGAVKCILRLCTIPQPENIDYSRHYSLAMFHYKNENYQDAARGFEECIRLSPNDSGLYAKASFCYEAIGKYSDALQCVRYGLIRCPEKAALSMLDKRLSKKVKL